MSGDETFALILALLIAGATWLFWFRDLLAAPRVRSAALARLILGATSVACGLILFAVLRRFASSDVRDDEVYLAFYWILGAAWVGLGMKWLEFCGLSTRDDVVERANRAAALAIAGALLGITLCFAGGNIGDGPGWWVVVFSGALSTGALFVAWVLLNHFTRVVDTVTVDRDVATGLRMAGFFIGAGLILGRAVAGDWTSAGATIFDFVLTGWPIAVLVTAAVIVERKLQPSPELPERPFLTSILPLLVYLGIAVAALKQAGPWK